MTALAAALAFVAAASLVLWLWLSHLPPRLAHPGRRKPAGPDQDPVLPPPAPGYWERLERAAAAAGLPWNRRRLQQVFALGLGAGFFSWLLGFPGLGLACAAAGLLVPRWVIALRRRQRAEQFAAALPQALQLAANTLRAGGTWLQAVEAVAQQMAPPLGDEFRLALQAMRLGTPAAEALAQIRDRIGLPAFHGVVVARVSTELGGNPATSLERLAQSLLDAQAFRRTVRAYTTEGRLSAGLVTALPFLVMGALSAMAPTYFAPVFRSPAGHALLLGCLVLMGCGWLLIHRITNPDWM